MPLMTKAQEVIKDSLSKKKKSLPTASPYCPRLRKPLLPPQGSQNLPNDNQWSARRESPFPQGGSKSPKL